MQTVRVRSRQLEALLGQVEALLQVRSTARSLAGKARRAGRPVVADGTASGEGDGDLVRLLDGHARHLSQVVEDLLRTLHDMLLLPLDAALESFPPMVRRLAREQGKQAELHIHGGETGVDRRVLEQVHDVFLHLLRNAVDHGLETPEIRRAAGKPETGRVDVRVARLGTDRVQVVVEDDGAGVNLDAVRDKAARLGLLDAEAAAGLDRRAALALLTRSAFSTRDEVSTLSGRGLGMAIAQEKVERAGGSLRLDSEPGRGFSARLELPLSLMSLRGVVLRVHGRRMVAPRDGLRRVRRLAAEDCQPLAGADGCLASDDRLPVASLGRVLGLPEPAPDAGGASSRRRLPVLVVGGEAGHPEAGRPEPGQSGPDELGLQVDAILGETEVALRGLGPQIRRLPGVAGVAVLEEGELVPVLNLEECRAMAFRGGASLQAGGGQAGGGDAVPPRRHKVLVAEDSITSRMLLKNVLEAAGYEVHTAVDGQDALERLRRIAVDVLISDVEMPRLDGLGLTRAVREDRLLASLPVVLITSLGSPEHQEAGMLAGADAYIVKSKFDQSDLLQTLRRLVPA